MNQSAVMLAYQLEVPLKAVPVRARNHRADIDGLRAVAVIVVIINHFHKNVVPSGYLGVDMFFVISGYVITASLARRQHDTLIDFIGTFYSARLKRLMPALVACVAVTCIVGSLFINPTTVEFRYSFRAAIHALFGLSNIYFFRHATDYFGSSAELNLFTHTWSLGVEEQFYLVFPVAFWLSGFGRAQPNGWRNLFVGLGLATAFSFSYFVWMSEANPPGAYFLMPARFWELGTGCITCLLAGPKSSLMRSGSELLSLFASIVLGAALFAPIEKQIYATPAVVICTAILIGTLRPNCYVYRFLTIKPIVFIGLISYSLYLWHWSVLVISRWTIGVSWLTAPIQVSAIIILSALSYFYVERPFRWKTWSKSRLRTIGYALAATSTAALFVFVLEIPLKGVLYTGSPAKMVEKGGPSLHHNKYANGKLIWPVEDCILTSDRHEGTLISADICTVGNLSSSKRRFLVIGNSFSAAEFEMYTSLTEANIGSVTVTSSWGASPIAEVPASSPWIQSNAQYWNVVIPSLAAELKRGDFLVMINDVAGFSPEKVTVESEHQLTLLKNGLSRLAVEMELKGVGIIFQSGNPFAREAGCDPDMAKSQWFNLINQPVCKYYTRDYSIERLRNLNTVLQNLQKEHRNFYILDLFDVFCASSICKFDNGKGEYLYRDPWSHPSVEANYLARPVLLSLVERAIRDGEHNNH
jgi:peptidoglycan/LPS O-acetylase OafA/YrhL